MTDSIRQKLEAIRKVRERYERVHAQARASIASLEKALEIAVDALEKWQQPGRAAEARMEKILADINQALETEST